MATTGQGVYGYGLNYGYDPGANYHGGVNALLQRPSNPYVIDMLAAARGQQMADDVGWLDRQRDIQNAKYQDWEEARDINRQAAEYLVPLTNNYYSAIAAGESPSAFLINQRKQMLEHPGFWDLDPKVQARVQATYANNAKVEINNLLRAGRIDEAANLSKAFGLTAVPDKAAVLQSGDAAAIIRQANPNVQFNETGDGVYINGQLVPTSFVAEHIIRANGNFTGANIASEAWRRQQEVEGRRQALLGLANGTDSGSTGNAVAQALGINGQPPQQGQAQPQTQAQQAPQQAGRTPHYDIGNFTPDSARNEWYRLIRIYNNLQQQQYDPGKYNLNQLKQMMGIVSERADEMRNIYNLLSGESEEGRGAIKAFDAAAKLREDFGL